MLIFLSSCLQPIKTLNDLPNETQSTTFDDLPNADSDHLYPFINKIVYDEDCRAGYIDAAGNIIIEPKYTYAGRFSEGFASVSEGEDSGYYYIDSMGRKAFDKVFKYAGSFSCGRAVIMDSDDNYSIIDTDGEIIAALEDIRTWRYADDMLLVMLNNGTDIKFGYADLNGKIVIPPIYDYATDFHEGFAAVSSYDEQKIQIINKHGDTVLDSDYGFDVIGFADRIADGLICVNRHSGHNAGYIDIKGNIIIPLQFMYAEDFSEGLARVCDENGLWGFIDKTGKYVIEPQFVWAGDFNEGVAAVYKSDPYSADVKNGVGFIDKNGALIIDYMYSTFYAADPKGDLELLNKADGLIDVMWGREGGIWRGYINDNNEIIFEVKLI